MGWLMVLVLTLLPTPLLGLSIKAGHLRTFPSAVMAFAGVYGFLFLGSGIVVSQPSLYSDAFTYSLLVVLGIFTALYTLIFALKDKLLISWEDHSRVPARAISLLLICALWVYSAGTFALYSSRHGLPALFSLNLRGEVLDLYAIRAEKSTDLAEGMQWYKLGLQTIPLLIFIYTYAWSVFTRSKLARTVFWVCLPAVLVLVNSFATKDGVVYVIEYALLIGLVAGSLRLSSPRLWLLVGAALGSVFLWLRIYLLDRSTLAVLATFGQYLLGRTVGAYVEAHAYALRTFPADHSFFYGTAFANPGGVLPFTPVNLSRFLGIRVLGTISNYATSSFTQGFANFGWLGIFLIGALMCAELLVIQWFFTRLPKNLFVFTLYIYVAGRMIGFGRQSIESVLPPEVIVVLLGVGAMYWLFGNLLTRGSLGRTVSRDLPTQAHPL